MSSDVGLPQVSLLLKKVTSLVMSALMLPCFQSKEEPSLLLGAGTSAREEVALLRQQHHLPIFLIFAVDLNAMMLFLPDRHGSTNSTKKGSKSLDERSISVLTRIGEMV